MAVETTPLGYQKPDGATELVKRGAQVISENAQKNQEHIAAVLDTQAGIKEQATQDRARLAAVEAAVTMETNFDGGGPGTIFAPEQLIDGGLA